MAGPVNALLGRLRSTSLGPNSEAFAYTPLRRPWRGVVELLAALAAAVVSFLIATQWKVAFSWVAAAPFLLVCAVLAARGLSFVAPRPLFRIAVDTLARTLVVSMKTEKENALAKIDFAEVAAVELAAKGEAWSLGLPLSNGRRIGLGLFAAREEADALGIRFAALLGVELRRPPG